MATYLSAVNDVLARLRQSSVATVATSTYSTLIGKFVNDAKTSVEQAWNWDALGTTITVSTSASTSNQVVTGSGKFQKGVTVNNTTSKFQLINKPIQWIVDQQDMATVQNGPPRYYAWNGTDGTDSKVEFFPTPDAVYSIKFHMYVPQALLTNDSDVITVPYEAVVMGAYARAIVERGEDGGLSSSEAYGLYKGILADQIAIESARYTENDCWVAT